jgi:hypothetical protein
MKLIKWIKTLKVNNLYIYKLIKIKKLLKKEKYFRNRTIKNQRISPLIWDARLPKEKNKVNKLRNKLKYNNINIMSLSNLINKLDKVKRK